MDWTSISCSNICVAVTENLRDLNEVPDDTKLEVAVDLKNYPDIPEIPI